MRRSAWIATLGVLALAGSAAPAAAQYVAPPPPVYVSPPPPPVYYRPRRPAFGGRCNAFLPTAYGPRREICPIARLRPISEPCRCPPPPNYGPGPWMRGRVIR